MAHDSHLHHDDSPAPSSSSSASPLNLARLPPAPSEAVDTTSGCDLAQARRSTPYRPWQDIAADKKAEQRCRISKTWHIISSTVAATCNLRPLTWTAARAS